MSVYIKENGAWVEVSGGSGANSLNELSDVSISNPQTNEVLKYNGTNWVNDTDDTGSGSGTVTTVTVEQENRASTCNDPITVSTPSTGVQQIDIGDDSNAHGTKFVGTTEPVSSCDGDIWYDTTEGGDIFLLDDDKLVFGTNPSTPGNTNHQLEIYSSPTTGTGGSQVIKSASTDRAIRIQTNGTFIVEGANGNIADVRLETTTDGIDIGGTGSIKVPVGTTAQRNSSPTAGDFRYNSDLGQFEGYTTAWGEIGGGSLSVTDNTTGSSTRYPILVDVTTGSANSTDVSSTKLKFLPSTGNLSATSFTSLSDVNKKKNITKIDNALEITQQLEGVRFDWKDTHKSSLGLIAQEVEKVLPELVETSDDGTKSVSYGNIIGVLIEAIKEQQKQIDTLKRR